MEGPVKVYWVGYDGDAELFAVLRPGETFTVDSFETHPWRVVDARSGQTLQEFVALRGEQTLRLDPLTTGPAGAPPPAAPQFEGFDGVGAEEADFVPAQVAEVALDHLGGVALLAADGFGSLIPLPVGVAEAGMLLHSSVEFRRPTTVATWVQTLQAAGADVARVLVTRVVGSTFYARIVLRLPGGAALASVDARPSDALAVAMRCGAPVFVARRIAAAQQPGSLEHRLGMYADAEPPAPRAERADMPTRRGQYDRVQHV